VIMTTTIDRPRKFRHYKALNAPCKLHFTPLMSGELCGGGASMRVLSQWVIMGLVLAGPAHAGGISGTYVGNGSNSAFFVQIVETAGGQLTGRYEQTVLTPDGKLNQLIASITGASDGQTVVVTIKPTELLSGGIAASGTVQGLLLHLSGGGDGSRIDINLSKSDETTYKTEVVGLRNRARAIDDARTEADQLAHLNDLTDKLITSSVAADAQLGKFPPIEQRYRTITGLMNAGLTRQRSIYGGGQAFVARGQIGVAINQAGGEAEQLHVSLQTANQDIGEKIQPLIMDATDTYQRCKSTEAEQRADWHTACLKFFDAARKFKQSVAALGRAFDQTEKTWMEERHKQEVIIQASDVASR
jgi:hypothetical protein